MIGYIEAENEGEDDVSNSIRLVPAMPLTEWITVWSECYDSKRFPASKYDSSMARLHKATDDSSLRCALKDAFLWKNGGKLTNSAKRTIATISLKEWSTWRASRNPPTKFSGAVWNVFLLHLASHGRRPMFDQHTWRAYCWITGEDCAELSKMPDQLACYLEYERWFDGQTRNDVDRRRFDQALMAFGQFIKGQFTPLLKRLGATEEDSGGDN